MTNIPAKRALPLNPHPDHLRKEAKARLAGLKGRMPSVKLTDVQLILAREYGFPNWGMLQAEVARRSGEGPRMRKAIAMVLSLKRASLESGHDPAVGSFFHAGLVAQVAFIIVALTGMGLVMVSQAPGFAHLAQLIHTVL